MLQRLLNLADPSKRVDMESRGVNNIFGQLGRYVVRQRDIGELDSKAWCQAAGRVLERVHQGYFEKPSCCDIDWDVYLASSLRSSLQSRFRCQFAGLVETIFAVAGWNSTSAEDALANAADHFREAAAAVDWQEPNSKSPRTQHQLKHFTAVDVERYRALERVFPDDWHAGHWTVYDLLGQWQWFSGKARRERRAVATPICLWLDSGTCQIPYLCVELTLGESGGFLPCADRLGLVLARRDPDGANGQNLKKEPLENDFMAAQQRAWVASGVSDVEFPEKLRVRGRWWIQKRNPSDDPIPILSGRSAEVSACCALWAALGGRPFDAQPLSRSELPMDDERPITGTLVVKAPKPGHRELLLGPVGCVLEKAQALPRHQLSGPLIIPEENSSECTDENRKLVMPLASVVDAYEQVLAAGRVRASYASAVDAEFRADWLPETVPPRLLQDHGGRETDADSDPSAVPGVDSVPADKHRSPYIRTQTILVLKETANPREYFRAPYTQSRRQRGERDSGDSTNDLDPWQPLGRSELLAGLKTQDDGTPGRLHRRFHRLAITSDAGMGKTTLLDWIWWELNSPTGDEMAIRVSAKELGDAFSKTGDVRRGNAAKGLKIPSTAILGLLIDKIQSTSHEGPRLPNEHIREYLIRLRSSGRLTVLVDGLDELRVEDDRGCQAIQFLAKDTKWQACRLVIAGRPYALEESWNRIFLRGKADGWSFLIVDEFNEREQAEYLGSALHEQVKDVASELMSVPRSLYYLRRFVTYAEKIRTASDLYLTAVVKIVADGFQSGVPGGKRAAGCLDENDKPILKKEQALQLLSAFAYHLTVVKGGEFNAVTVDQGMRTAIAELCREASQDNSINANFVERGLQCLSAMGGPLNHDILEGGTLERLQFRNRQLQEFLAGLWMARWLCDSQLRHLSTRLPLAHDAASQTWYWTFRFATEMPLKSLAEDEPFEGRSGASWIRAMSTVYCVGDGTAVGTRRSTELIVRGWPTLTEYVENKNPMATDLLNHWRGEFQTILDRGDAMAREFTESFVEIPGGTLKMGSSMTDEKYWWNWNHEPTEMSIEIADHSISRFPMPNGYYRLFDPGNGPGESKRRSFSVRYSSMRSDPCLYSADTSWWDAKAVSLWFRWKSATADKKDAAKSFVEYTTRLPNEAEMEWVAKARAASNGRYPVCYEFPEQSQIQPGNSGIASLQDWHNNNRYPLYTGRLKTVEILSGPIMEYCVNVYQREAHRYVDRKPHDNLPDRVYRSLEFDSKCRPANRVEHSLEDKLSCTDVILLLVSSRSS